MLKTRIIVCLLNFLVAALMGLLLRYVAIGDVEVNYRFLTHAHSHVAMLGWVYLMLFTFLLHYFVPKQKPIYQRLFWITEIAVIGMMLSFPFQGYAAISITFSTLHILCSYYFVYLIWKDHRKTSTPTTILLRASLLFMLLSTLGVWCLGPAVGLMGKASAFYQIAIQFFLHFQFNGWFLFAVFAIFFHLLNIKDSKSFRRLFYVLIGSTILTLALPIQWFAPHSALLTVNVLGVILQGFTVVYFFKVVNVKLNKVRQTSSKLMFYSLGFGLSCFVIKSGVQLVSVVPFIAEDLIHQRNFVIGFIHLLMLGLISGFLFFFLLHHFKCITRIMSLGLYSFFIGFLCSELLLLIQGLRFYSGKGIISNYYELLFVSSLCLPLGIVLITIAIQRLKLKTTSTLE